MFDLPPDFRGQQIRFAEQIGKVASIFETGAIADFDNRQIAVRERVFGKLDAFLH